jgi:hypothetical protein
MYLYFSDFSKDPSKFKPGTTLQKTSSSYLLAFNEKDMLFLRNQFRNNEVKFYKIMSQIESDIWVYTGHAPTAPTAPSTPSIPINVSPISSNPRRAFLDGKAAPSMFTYSYEDDDDWYAN